MRPQRGRAVPVDNAQYIGRQAELFAKELGAPRSHVRYVELVEHDGRRWSRRFAWQRLVDGQWRDVEWRPPTH